MTIRPAGMASSREGMLVINADDWGRDARTTDTIVACARAGALSSASAMVYMEDSERAATLARAQSVDVGLHLNLDSPLTSPSVPARLVEHQQRLAGFLRRSRMAQVVFNPTLSGSFEYVVAAQLEEYRRLYGESPERIDGHHHMHLCANVVQQKLLPAGTLVRRNFSFRAGEKSLVNRLYRRWIDSRLAKRHRLVDFLFTLPPLEPLDRLLRVFDLARTFVVELETHPVNREEFEFLTGGAIFRHLGAIRVAANFLPSYGR